MSGSRHALGPTDRIVARGMVMVPVGPVPGGATLLRQVGAPHLTQVLSDEEFEALYDEADFRYDPGYYAASTQATLAHAGTLHLSDLPAAEQATCERRLAYCKAAMLLPAPRSLAAVQEAIDAVAEARRETGKPVRSRRGRTKNVVSDAPPKKPRKTRSGTRIEGVERPSVRTVCRWLRKLEGDGTAGEQDGYGFNPCNLSTRYRRCGNREGRLPASVRRLMHARVEQYATEKGASKRHLHNLLAADTQAAGLTAPSYRTFSAAVDALDKFAVHAGRHGLENAKKKFLMLGEGLDVRRPLERVELDHWNVQLQTILEDNGVWSRLSAEQKRASTGRLHVCVAIDCASRAILAMRLSRTPSVENAILCLEMACSRDKAGFAELAGAETPWDMCGTPHMIATDTGPEFLSDLQVTVARLNAGSYLPPAGMPTQRARIERIFRSLEDRLLPYFTGRTKGNVAALAGYPAQERASLDVEALSCALVRWVVDIYHNMPHGGLGGETPRRAWHRLLALYPVVPPPDGFRRRAVFGRKLTRILGRHGVRVLGLNYQCAALHALFCSKGEIVVEVSVDLWDLGRVSVRQGTDWVTADCMTAEAYGVSADAWIAAATDLARRHEADADLDRAVVARAAHDLEALAGRAEARAGIAGTRLTAKQIDAAEKGLRVAFSSPAAAPAGPRQGILAAARPRLAEAPPPTAPASDAAVPEARAPAPVGRPQDGDVVAERPRGRQTPFRLED